MFVTPLLIGCLSLFWHDQIGEVVVVVHRNIKSFYHHRQYWSWHQTFIRSLCSGLSVLPGQNMLQYTNNCEIFAKKICEKFRFLPKLSIFLKNFDFYEKFWFVYEKFRFIWKISIFMKNFDFDEKFRFWWKISILMNNFDFAEKFRFWWKISIFTKFFYETFQIQIPMKNF